MKGIIAALSTVLVLAAIPSAFATGGHDDDDHKVTICHATGSSSNPFVRISPSASGVYHGHIAHQHGEDIIPPFQYNVPNDGQGTRTFSQNWNATGQAIFNNGCSPPPPPPQCPSGTTPVAGSNPLVCIKVVEKPCEPVIIYKDKIVYVDRPVEKIVYKDRIVIKEVPVETIILTTIFTRNFVTMRSLKTTFSTTTGVLTVTMRSGPGTSTRTSFTTSRVIAHRTTHDAPFRRLHELRRGDRIYVNRRTYVVRRTARVRATEVWVLNYRGVVLSACDPPGWATLRLVVFARPM